MERKINIIAVIVVQLLLIVSSFYLASDWLSNSSVLVILLVGPIVLAITYCLSYLVLYALVILIAFIASIFSKSN